MRLIVYKAIQISLFVGDFKFFGLLSLLELVLHCHGACTTSYLYYLVVEPPLLPLNEELITPSSANCSI